MRKSLRPSVTGEHALFTTVTARSFRLVDEEGKLRALVGFSARGDPGFSLFAGQGTRQLVSRAELVLGPRGPALSLSEATGVHRITVELTDSGPQILLFEKPRGRRRMGLLRFVLFLDDSGNLLRMLAFDRRGRQMKPQQYTEVTKDDVSPRVGDAEAWLRRQLERLGK